jgi:uncharacterized OsmC-like protein
MSAGTPRGLDPTVKKREIKLKAVAEHLENMQHQATVSHFGRDFVITSDEPDVLGGDNEYPTPMEYFTASIGFCLLTQIERYSRMLDAKIARARCTVYADFGAAGSILAGTIESWCRGIVTEVEIESDESPELVAAVIHNADQGCYLRSTVRAPAEMHTTVQLNGEPLELADYSPRPPR